MLQLKPSITTSCQSISKTRKSNTLDVDDDAAQRIMLVDNKSSDDAGYDESALALLVKEAHDARGLEGTGYSIEELEELTGVNRRWEPVTAPEMGSTREFTDADLESAANDPREARPRFLDNIACPSCGHEFLVDRS